VKLLNTEGLALLGPGSEWFWTMLQFAALSITFFALYRQLRAQRSASMFEQIGAWHREWSEARAVRARLEVALDIEAGRTVDAGLPPAGPEVAIWFERIGYLVAQGHIRPRDAWNDSRPNIARWWWLLGPYIEAQRVMDKNPRAFEWFEFLELEMRRIDLRVDGAVFADRVPLGQVIDNLTAVLQRERDAAAGVIPTHRVAQPPAPMPAEQRDLS